MENPRTVAEFFAGIGLMRMGLEQAGWEVVWANDIDQAKMGMYCGHFRGDNAHFHLGDVHAVVPHEIPPVALATASFPCNDLSLAGARRGLAGQQSGAFWGFIDAIRGMGRRRPLLLMLENVVGFLTSHDGNDFRDACLALNELGYAVDAFIVDAVRFVPQSRQRLFLIGKREKRKAEGVGETLTFYESQCRPAALADFILWHPEIRWAMRDLPGITGTSAKLQDIVEEVPVNSPYWWSRQRAEYLLGQMSEKHRAIAEKMIGHRKVSYGTVFRRVRRGRSMAELRTDGIAGCLRTPRGGSGRQILFVAGKGRYAVRLLTPRECARLMGAGDFRITTSLNQALFGFGDAVCVPVIRWIAENYLTPAWKELHAKESTKERYAAAI
ncbi:MAG: DNA (cytosine-5-)-methyltransferase [Nitrospira sp. CR2.1]|nr:DNA (cytosine-5-)-methyltransferase [Nitrospira sp. CR2.1]MBA5874132.1 DNA (cytosine-5-)-methyltransferase [Nitrospira sp. CR1.2]